MAEKWAVVKNAGFVNERVASIWFSYNDAYCSCLEQYSESERAELHVDVMKWDDEAQDWTTEY